MKGDKLWSRKHKTFQSFKAAFKDSHQGFSKVALIGILDQTLLSCEGLCCAL